MIPHALAIKDSMHKQKCLDQLSDIVFLLRTPNDPAVFNSGLVKGKKIRVKRNYHAFLGGRICQLLVVGQAGMSCFLRRNQLDAAPSQAFAYRQREMLVKIELNRLMHPVFLVVQRVSLMECSISPNWPIRPQLEAPDLISIAVIEIIRQYAHKHQPA